MVDSNRLPRIGRTRMLGARTLLVMVGLLTVLCAGCSGSALVQSSDTPSTDGLVVAVRPNNPSFIVINIDGTARTYGPETHHLPKDAVSGVVISPTGDVLVGIGPRVYVVRDADFTREPIELSPSKIWPTGGYANEVYASATLDGSTVWIVQTVPGPNGSGITIADLVRIDDGILLSSTTIERPLVPVGTTYSDRLVLQGDQVESVALSVDGAIESLGSGIVAAVGANHIAVLTDDRRHLVIHEYEDSSRTERPITPPSDNGTWGLLGGDFIPHVSIPWQTLSPDGQLLIPFRAAREDDPLNWNLYLITKAAHGDYQSTLLTTDFGFSDAAWTENYQSIWLLKLREVRLMRPRASTPIEDKYSLDDEHFILAAG